MAEDQLPIPRQILAVTTATVALTLAVLVASAIVLGVFAALTVLTPRPVVLTTLLLVTIIATAAGCARLLARHVIPPLAATAYMRSSPQRARNLVWIASLFAGLVCAGVTSGEGALASLFWLAAVTAGGIIGAARTPAKAGPTKVP